MSVWHKRIGRRGFLFLVALALVGALLISALLVDELRKRHMLREALPGIELYPGATRVEVQRSEHHSIFKVSHGVDTGTYQEVFRHYDKEFEAAGFSALISEASVHEDVREMFYGWPHPYSSSDPKKHIALVLSPPTENQRDKPEGVLILVTSRQIAKAPGSRPNIVIILADDQRYDALHCTGHPFAETPHTDRLAAEGVLFTNAVVSTPLCAPNRACLFTGTFANTHGNRNNGVKHYLPHDDVRPPMPVPCFPALLRDAGYTTCLIGKWHAGERSYPDHGFEHFEPSSAKYVNPSFWNGEEWVPREGFLTDLIAEKAADWIRDQGDRPFLAVVSHVAPHLPVVVPERYRDLYAGAEPRRRPNEKDDCSDKSQFTRNARSWFADMREQGETDPNLWPPPVSDEQHRDLMRLNRALDDSVGTIRQALEETGKLDETIFIYHSDNGFFLGEHGLSAKYYPYEEALRVPLIIRYPKEIEAGLRLDAPVSTLDIGPSLLEWAGVTIPDTMGGASLASLLSDPNGTSWREATFHEYFHHQGDPPPVLWLAVRTQRWKYIRFARPFDEELYDLESDPHEMENLAGKPEYERTLKDMRALMDRTVRETGADAIVLPEPGEP